MEDEIRKLDYKKIYLMLKPLLRPFWMLIPLFAGMALVMSLLSLAEPFIYGTLIDRLVKALSDRALVSSLFSTLTPWLLAWAGVVVVSVVISAGYSFLRWHFGNQFVGIFLRDFYARLLRLDIARFREERGGDLLRRFDNAGDGGVWRLNEELIRSYLPAFFLFIFSFIVGLWIDWRLLMIAVAPIPLIVALGIYNLRNTEPHQRRVHKIWDKTSGLVGDAFSNITTVKSFVGESLSVSRYWNVYQLAFKSQSAVNKKWALSDAIDGGVYILGRLAIFLAGSWFVIHGTATLGTLVMFLGFENYLYNAVQQVVNSLPEFTRGMARLQRAADLWFEIPMIQDKPKARSLARLRGEVEFRGVSYRYGRGKEVLKSIDLRIPAGKTYAVVGESGAGKSTLAQLLLRFYDPSSGQLLFDGVDLRDLTLKTVRQNVGFVMQENLLFHDTILNNIRFAKPRASEREVMLAAKRAQAHEFIARLPQKYAAVVGERGVKLSGGERQRIALARVLLANPPILVLDEATSALDSKTEHALQLALHEVMQERTTLVIAHRLSTVMGADQIVVMHHGQIVDQGKHQDLITRDTLYKQYWEIQAGGYV